MKMVLERDNTVEFSAANWNQKLVLHLCNLVKTWATVLSWNQKTFPFMQVTKKPLKTNGTAQFFPGSCALSTCRNSLAPRLFPPQKTPALHLYAYHSSVWLCCKGVAFVHVLVFATSLHSMLLLVFIPCYFWSSFHATSGLHSMLLLVFIPCCFWSSFHSRKTEHGTGNWRLPDCTHYPLCPGERRVQQKKHICFKFSLVLQHHSQPDWLLLICHVHIVMFLGANML